MVVYFSYFLIASSFVFHSHILISCHKLTFSSTCLNHAVLSFTIVSCSNSLSSKYFIQTSQWFKRSGTAHFLAVSSMYFSTATCSLKEGEFLSSTSPGLLYSYTVFVLNSRSETIAPAISAEISAAEMDISTTTPSYTPQTSYYFLYDTNRAAHFTSSTLSEPPWSL